jgi:hypothetical protein
VFEQWVSLAEYASAMNSVANKPLFDSWIDSLGVRGARDPLPLMKMRSHTARLAQFPVVLHGTAIGISDARPVVFGIAEVLTAVYMDAAFGRWLQARIAAGNGAYTHLNVHAGIISGPDMHHLDPYIHMVVKDFGARRAGLVQRLNALRAIKDTAPVVPVEIYEEGDGSQSEPRALLMMGTYSSAALMVAAYLIAP